MTIRLALVIQKKRKAATTRIVHTGPNGLIGQFVPRLVEVEFEVRSVSVLFPSLKTRHCAREILD